MSCMFRAGGDQFDVDAFLLTQTLTPYQVWRVGEPRNVDMLHTWSGFSVKIGSAGLKEFDKQIEEAIAFAEANVEWISKLIKFPGLRYAVFDFARQVPADTTIPSFYFPPDLIKCAALMGVGLQASIYYASSRED